MRMLHYTIQPKNLGAHLVAVRIDVPASNRPEDSANGDKTNSKTSGDDANAVIIAKMPKWIPGSYKIRDYSRHVQAFQAVDGNGQAVAWHKTDSDTWVIAASGCAVTLRYDVYAYDLSVRGAYLDDTRWFFNHCCLCFDIVHLSEEKRLIDIGINCDDNGSSSDGSSDANGGNDGSNGGVTDDWLVFTALPQADAHGTDRRYVADSYAHQIDCPVESVPHAMVREFTLAGVTHQVVFTGSVGDDDDIDSMTRHIKNICAAEMRLFGGTPLDRYLFLNYIEAGQYGGLEHKNSVAQIAAPTMMMKKGQPLTDKNLDFLGLCSHEYFHLWNIKRLQPKDFQPYDLYREQHTEMLWLFEGFTSYYDELFLLRGGVVEAQTFLNRQAQNLTRVLNSPGRKLQPLAASSFDAWTKLYQADANSPNHMVSYYAKGAVFALFLDLFLRFHSNNQASLDDVMRHLWQHFGERGIGIDEDDVFTACARRLPKDKHEALSVAFVNGLHGTDDVTLEQLFPEFGVAMHQVLPKIAGRPQTTDAGLRLKIADGTTKSAKIVFLDATSDAAKQGVSVDDDILAVNHQDAQSVDFNACLTQGKVSEVVQLTLSRRGRVFDKSIRLAAATQSQVTLTRINQTIFGSSWLMD